VFSTFRAAKASMVASGSLVKLHAALDEAVVCCRPASAPLSRPAANKLWYSVADLLRDSLCELAQEASSDVAAGDAIVELPRLREGWLICAGVASRLKSEAPPLYAVAKHSLKRNGDLRAHRNVLGGLPRAQTLGVMQ